MEPPHAVDRGLRPVIAAVDGSPHGGRALEWAVSQALMAGTPLRIVHARLHMNTIGAVLSGTFDRAGVDDDPVLVRVRGASPAVRASPRSSTSPTPAPPTPCCRTSARAPG